MLAAVNSDAGSLVSLADIRAAAERIQGVVLRSPVIALPHPADPDRLLHCKAESLQPTGAFKLRGAYNTISQVLETAREKGIVAQSSGNHAQIGRASCRDIRSRSKPERRRRASDGTAQRQTA